MKNILVISINGDQSTDNVIDWLHYLKNTPKRINTEDILLHDIKIYSNEKSSLDSIPLKNFDAVWYRRSLVTMSNLNDKISDPELRKQASNHSYREKNALLKTIFAKLNHARWLSSPSSSSPNKEHVLDIARKIGMHTPESIITNNKKALLDFYTTHQPIIVKNVGDSESFSIQEKNYITYTSVVDLEFIEQLKDTFFPCLFQVKIEKELELRVFHLDGKNYSMAIFSQNDEQTSVDFRKYNSTVPNRTVPFQLPPELDKRVNQLMKELELKTGSLDFIMSDEGKYYFLEVNPVGQFGMVSAPCNYQLEKKIAKYLIS